MIDYLIRAKRSDGGAELDERTPLGAQIADRVPLHMGTRLDDLKRVWYEQMDIRTTLAILTGSRAQPLDLVAEYFGASCVSRRASVHHAREVAFVCTWRRPPPPRGGGPPAPAERGW